MKNKIEKIDGILNQIEELSFSHSNCLKIIYLVKKINQELSFFDGKATFKDNIKQTINKEIQDLLGFSGEDQLERLFNNVKAGILMDKRQYWDIDTFDK